MAKIYQKVTRLPNDYPVNTIILPKGQEEEQIQTWLDVLYEHADIHATDLHISVEEWKTRFTRYDDKIAKAKTLKTKLKYFKVMIDSLMPIYRGFEVMSYHDIHELEQVGSFQGSEWIVSYEV